MSDKKSSIFISCEKEDKAVWVQAARLSESKQLEKWVIETLNAAAKKLVISAPDWMSALPGASQKSLVDARILKPSDVFGDHVAEKLRESGVTQDQIDHIFGVADNILRNKK